MVRFCKKLWYIGLLNRPVIGMKRKIGRNNLRIAQLISIPVQPGDSSLLVPVQPLQVAL